jgi:hypothetical protein
MTGDNPTSPTGVASCAYDETKYTQFSIAGQFYNVVDNFEFTGICWNGNESNANEFKCCTEILNYSQGSTTPSNNIVENVYIHGWTHVTFSCSLAGNGEPTGSCDGAIALNGTSNSTYGHGDLLTHDVVDGSDTDGLSMIAVAWACYDVEDSVFRYNSNAMVCNNLHILANNLFEYILQSGDGVSHGNAWESNTESNSVNSVYNNIWRNLWLSRDCEVTNWETPQITDYYFNNLIYNNGCAGPGNGNYYDLVGGGQGGATGWTANVFNNTWVLPNGGAVFSNPVGTTANFYNNDCIVPGGGAPSSCYSGGAGALNYLTNKVQDTSTAAGQGYTSSEIYAYSPTAAGNTTVGTGTNEQGLCSALTGSADPLLQAAGTACQSDTGYACTYSTSTHAVSCPARTVVARPGNAGWDVGAYQLSGAQGQTGTQAQPPQAPTNLQATVQ